MNENRDQLKALWGGMEYPDSAEKAVEEIVQGLDILHTHPAPLPDAERMASIKRRIQIRLVQTRTSSNRFRWIGWGACAAAILLAAILLIHPKENSVTISPVVQRINPAPWKIDTPPTLSGDLGQGMEDILTANPNQDFPDTPDPLEKLEFELQMLASTDDFWKG